MKVALLALMMAIAWRLGSGRRIIMNEDDLIGTCTGTCSEVRTLYNKNGCTKLSGCFLNSEGWNEGFVRCDYCECECAEPTPTRDIVVINGHISSDEDRLYGTCTGTCDKSGLVRTDSHGCQEIRDCFKEQNGWNRGFVRCDYCTCTCATRKYANKYEITNIRYDLSEAALYRPNSISIYNDTFDNDLPVEQKFERSIEYTYRQEKSITSSHSMEIGLQLSVDAGITIGEAVSISRSMVSSITSKWETSNTRTNITETKATKTFGVTIPAYSSIIVLVSTRRMKIDVPYTATLVITFPDGSNKAKPVFGILTNVDYETADVSYRLKETLQHVQKHASKYALKNIEYDMSKAVSENPSLGTLVSITVQNEETTEREIERDVEYMVRREKSITSNHSLEIGLKLSVDAGITTGEAAGVSSSMVDSITRSWETSNTRTNITETKETMTVKVKVPGRSSVSVIISRKQMKIDVPYTATLVTMFSDNSNETNPVSGIVTNVDYDSVQLWFRPKETLQHIQKHASKYALKNIEYDMSKAVSENPSLSTLMSITVQNEETTEREIERDVQYIVRREKSITSNHSLEIGLELSVDAGITTGEAAGVSSSMVDSITRSWETSNTRTNITETKETMTIKVKVPGRSSVSVMISAEQMKIDVPYTATLVTMFSDSSNETEPVSGMLTNVDYDSIMDWQAPPVRLAN